MWAVVAKVGVSLLVAGIEKWLASDEPTPDPEPPPQLGPIVTAGTSIPILFGTAQIDNPPMLWRDVAIGPKSTEGGQHIMGVRAQFLLCYGPVVRLNHILIENGRLKGAPADLSDIATYNYRDPSARWYDLHYSPWTIYTGRTVQPSDPLLDVSMPTAAGVTYKDVAHIVMGEIETPAEYNNELRGPYMSARWKYVTDADINLTFVVASDPSGTASALMPNSGSNPARILEALYTNEVFGDSVDPAELDLTSFDMAADLLADEGWGLTYLVTGEKGSNELKKDVLRHIGGVLDEGSLYLIRPVGTLVNGLPYDDTITDIDDSKILEMIAYAVENIFDRPNAQTIRYIRRGFYPGGTRWWGEQESFATASDISDPSARTIYAPDLEFLAIPNEELAQKVAKRELNAAQARLATMMVQVKTDRTLRKGRRVRVSSAALGIPEAIYRIKSVDHGTPEVAATVLTLIEDVYTWHENTDGPTVPVEPPVSPKPDPGFVFEAPYRLVPANNNGVVAGVAAKTHDGNDKYSLAGDPSNVGDTDSPIDYVDQFFVLNSVPFGVDMITSWVTIDDTPDASMLNKFAYWGEHEIVTIVDFNAPTREIQLNRGMLDTVPHSHDAGERLWVFAEAVGGVMQSLAGHIDTDVVVGFEDARILPITTSGTTLAYDAAQPNPITLKNRWDLQYPPRDVSFVSRQDKYGGFQIRFRGNSRDNAPILQAQDNSNPVGVDSANAYTIHMWGNVGFGVEGYIGELLDGINCTITPTVDGGSYSTITVTAAQELAMMGGSMPNGPVGMRSFLRIEISGRGGIEGPSYQAFPAYWP